MGGWDLGWWWAGILFLLVNVAYVPAWSCGFIWDDRDLVLNNPVIAGPLGVAEIWTTKAADVCPLTLTTFWLEHQVWGLQPLGYHLVNILFHAANAIVLWRVLRALRIPAAGLAAALWALHPVQVESVTWVIELKNTESGLFYLLSILFFAKYLRGAASTSFRLYLLAAIFAALAMASKSSTVILPLVFGLCAWWVRGTLRFSDMLKIAPLFLLSILTAMVSVWTQGVSESTGSAYDRSWLERLLSAADACWFYLGKLAWPHPLLLAYPRWTIDPEAFVSYLPLVAAIGVSVVSWVYRTTWARPWFFAWFYFVIALLPALGFVNMSYFFYSFVADHFQYLASVGPIALAAAGLAWLARRFFPGREATAGVGVVLVVVAGALTWLRTATYENEVALWAQVLTYNPGSPIAHYNLGSALQDKGRLDDAVLQYEDVMKDAPDSRSASRTYFNIGVIDELEHRPANAENAYRQAIEIDPGYWKAMVNLGVLYLRRNDSQDALVVYRKVIEIVPGSSLAHGNLGVALRQLGRIGEAVAEFREAVRLDPASGQARGNLASAENDLQKSRSAK